MYILVFVLIYGNIYCTTIRTDVLFVTHSQHSFVCNIRHNHWEPVVARDPANRLDHCADKSTMSKILLCPVNGNMKLRISAAF